MSSTKQWSGSTQSYWNSCQGTTTSLCYRSKLRLQQDICVRPMFQLSHLLTLLSYRYIGVLNVTYRYTPKKKKGAKDKAKSDAAPTTSATQSENASRQASKAPGDRGKDEQPRVVSHSQQVGMTIPQVIFENNRHIIPDNLFRVPPRSTTPDPWMRNSSILQQQHRRNQSDYGHVSQSPTRPPLQHTSSWGVTTINRKLQEEVLRQVFAPPPIHHRSRHHHHGISTRKAGRDTPQTVAGSAPTIRRNSTDVSGLHPPLTEECTQEPRFCPF